MIEYSISKARELGAPVCITCFSLVCSPWPISWPPETMSTEPSAYTLTDALMGCGAASNLLVTHPVSMAVQELRRAADAQDGCRTHSSGGTCLQESSPERCNDGITQEDQASLKPSMLSRHRLSQGRSGQVRSGISLGASAFRTATLMHSREEPSHPGLHSAANRPGAVSIECCCMSEIGCFTRTSSESRSFTGTGWWICRACCRIMGSVKRDQLGSDQITHRHGVVDMPRLRQACALLKALMASRRS